MLCMSLLWAKIIILHQKSAKLARNCIRSVQNFQILFLQIFAIDLFGEVLVATAVEVSYLIMYQLSRVGIIEYVHSLNPVLVKVFRQQFNYARAFRLNYYVVSSVCHF